MAAPGPAGENVEWFVANDRESKDQPGLKLALPALVEDEGLPYRPGRGQT